MHIQSNIVLILFTDTLGSVGHLRSGVFVQGLAAENALFHHCRKCLLYHKVGAYQDNQKTVSENYLLEDGININF